MTAAMHAIGEGGAQSLGVCIAAVGKSGAGKSAFMAKLALQISLETVDRPVLLRFCSTSKDSSTGEESHRGRMTTLCDCGTPSLAPAWRLWRALRGGAFVGLAAVALGAPWCFYVV